MKLNIKNWRTLLLAIIAVTSLESCSDDDNGPKGAFETGVFVVNEGNFQSANASISHFDPSTGNVMNNIYATSNSNAVLGDVAQSIFVSADVAYISVNNSNKMEVVNANTFEEITTIDALLPRYFISSGSKGYLTEWVSFGQTGQVSVIDLNSNTISSTITTDFGAEGMIISNDRLFVSNNFAANVSVIDLSTEQVVASINVNNGPGQFELDANGDIWLICAGGFDPNDFSPLNDGALYKIDPIDYDFTVIELERNVASKIAMNRSKDAVYYYSGQNLYKVGIKATSKPSNSFISESQAIGFYGLGVDPETDIIYLGDSKAFQANGTVFRYNADGTSIDNFTVGIAPNGFVFR